MPKGCLQAGRRACVRATRVCASWNRWPHEASAPHPLRGAQDRCSTARPWWPSAAHRDRMCRRCAASAHPEPLAAAQSWPACGTCAAPSCLVGRPRRARVRMRPGSRLQGRAHRPSLARCQCRRGAVRTRAARDRAVHAVMLPPPMQTLGVAAEKTVERQSMRTGRRRGPPCAGRGMRTSRSCRPTRRQPMVTDVRRHCPHSRALRT